MKTIGSILLVFLTLILSCYFCNKVKDIPIYTPAGETQPVPTATPEAPVGITFQTQPIPAATTEEMTTFWQTFWIVTGFVSAAFYIWFFVMLLDPLADGLDKLVGVLDRFRKVMFDSQIDDIQVRKSDRMSDLDVEIAGARFEHDRQKALIALDRIQDVTDIEVVERAHRLKMLQEQGRLSLRAKREAMKSEAIQ